MIVWDSHNRRHRAQEGTMPRDIFRHMMGEAAYDAFTRGIGVFFSRVQEKGGEAVVEAVKKRLEHIRHLIVPYFWKLGESGKPEARRAADNFFRNQREREGCQRRWDGQFYRPGDENRFMNLVARFYLAFEPKPIPMPSVDPNTSSAGKDERSADQVAKEVLAEFRKELQAFVKTQAAASGTERTLEEDRDNFFVWLFNKPDNEIEAVLEAVEHDPFKQTARRVAQDINSGLEKVNDLTNRFANWAENLPGAQRRR